MTDDNRPTTAQLRDDIDAGRTGSKVAAPDPAAAPLGTDDEAAGTPPSSDRVEMARQAERKIGEAVKGERSSGSPDEADDKAQSQRGSSAPYAKEDHMNEELLQRSRDKTIDAD